MTEILTKLLCVKFRLSNLPVLVGLILFVVIIPSPAKGQGDDSSSLFCPKALSSIPNVCDRFACKLNMTEADCPLDTIFVKGLTLCGCCPGCAKYIGLTKASPKDMPRRCTRTKSALTKSWEPLCEGPTCPILVNQCLPGLVCEVFNGSCSLPETPRNPCTEECMYKKSLKRLGLFHWDPICEEDGSYAPKQCKGDHVTGICFCVDRCGRRIFGQEFRVDSKNQTCACSRLANNLRSAGNAATMHCTPDGNFEPLQCDTDSGLCYCVHERTGKLNGAVVPEAEWEKLLCLTPNVTNFMRNGHYLRKCESNFAANVKIIKDGKLHGTEITLPEINCDYDGSFAPVKTSGTRKDCVYKNGTTIKDFFANSNNDMDCNCARDQFLYQIKGRPFSFVCQNQLGNYPNSVDFGSYASCIDRDGIAYGDMVPSKYACCLILECVPSTAKECQSDTNPGGYRSCCSWPYGGWCSGQT
ncbi:uncharacterized protein LOC110848903 [Folsomia candida]|uniref:uncharacterized protein LOC110848903 n=1 Tax=Folsomia candida TaxID=158441 RepID=UPI000B8F28CD|nr:uncharacterized protein LOC110848903 [Folsomia candida]